MLKTLRTLLTGPAATAGGLAALMVLALSGCSGDPGDGASQEPPGETLAVADMERFPAPPDSRSLGASDEPEARLRLPLDPPGQDGYVPSRTVEGRVFRRVSMVSSGDRFATLLDHYRGLAAEGGYEVLFECEGVEACGGGRFVGHAIEDYVTAPGNVARSSTVIALTQPTGGELAHFSLGREHAGVAEYVGITVSRSEKGPLTVVTQQAFVAAGN